MTQDQAKKIAKKQSSGKQGFYVFYNSDNPSPDYKNRYEVRANYTIDESLKNCSYREYFPM